MGHPRRFKNKYEAPKKLWEKDRIREEKSLRSEYGLKNSREIWIARAELKKYRREARRLLSMTQDERKAQEGVVLEKLSRFGILPKGSNVEDILGLDVNVILERRLQTRVFRKGIARTIRQARQLISHGFISVDGNVVAVPGYLVIDSKDASIKLSKKIDLDPKPPAEAKAEETTEEKPAEKTEAPEAKEEKKEPAKENAA